MSLPKLEISKYKTVLPSTGAKIDFRPFTVKEEKILMIAQESNEFPQIIGAMKEIISACTFNQVDANYITQTDLEYLFLQLRAKSVGETAEIRPSCTHCGAENELKVDLTQIKVKESAAKVDPKIMLNDNIGVVLRPLQLRFLEKIESSDIVSLVAYCIEQIFDNDNVYKVDDFSEKEIAEFVEGLEHKHLEKIKDYIESQPKLEHTTKIKCSSCAKTYDFKMKGLETFFI